MGNTEVSAAGTPASALTHFSKRFIISPHPLDPQQNLMFYMHQRLSNNKYILRVLSTNDSEDKQKMEDLICKKLAMTKNNGSVITIDHYIFEEDKGYCNSTNKCYLLFNPHNSEPLTHYLARGHYNHNLQKIINEDIVYKGLLNLIEGVALLKFYNHPHRHINCDTVYFQKQKSTFLLADPWISPLTDLHQQYHAPEKLQQMRNQIEKHDPYLADLFSIGMVGLKMLGHNNLTQYYTIHKNINQPGLAQLAQTIKNDKLRSLILKMLSSNIEVRDEVLNEAKLNSSQKKENGQNLTKTRHLSGKVASVRKSFVNDDRTIARLPSRNIQNNQLMQETNNSMFNTKVVQGPQFSQNNPFSKYKPPSYNNNNIAPLSGSNIVTQQMKVQQMTKKPSASDKPDIDIGFPLPTATQNSKFIAHSESARINFTIPSNIISNQNNQKVKFVNTTPTTAYLNSYSPTNPPYFSSNPTNLNNLNMPNNLSYTSLLNSNSDKFLKNVSSTPIQHQGSTQFVTGTTFLPSSTSQKVLNLQGNQYSNAFVKTQPLGFKKPSLSNQIQINKKEQPLAFSVLKNQVKINPVSPMTNVTISSPANTIKQHFKYQKQDLNPLRTNNSYPSSDSFQNDHINQNKIHQNLRNLQNKISQAINASRFHMTQNSRISNNISAINLSNSGRLIQSVIIPKQQDISSHNSTVKAINQQLQFQDSGVLHKLQRKQSGKAAKQFPKKQEIEPIQKYQKLSPILVRQSQNSPLHDDATQRISQQDHSSINQQSVDFLNVNSSKQSSEQKQVDKQIVKKVEQQQKFEDVVATPAKGPNIARLEGNNLTIPQQSDQQSIEGERPRYKGQYVQEVYENGGKYVGYMLNDQRNGNGIFYYKDGGYYDGRWKQNMMNGYGKLYYETGKLAYEGQWYQDQFHGRGTVYNDQPQEVPQQGFDYKNMNQSQNYWKYYEGDLSHDMKARYGKLMLSNGQYYEGQFKNDQVHGKGQFHKQDGTVVKGLWSQGILIRQI